jgi:pyruvyl transferase EpsO
MKVDLTKVQEIKNTLHKKLAEMETFSQCVLLDYPSHPNIGESTDWFG